MFGLTRKRGLTAGAAARPSPGPSPGPPSGAPEPPPDPDSQLMPLLGRWMSLADMQQRVIETLAAEIMRTSDFVETETDQLSRRFQLLAAGAQQQTTRVDSLTALAMGLQVEGRTIRIDEVASLFEGTLADVVEKIRSLAEDSLSMVDAMDTLGASVENVGKCNAGIDGINSTLNMLALNARIEGERAGSAGAGFRVVANEVYELSKSTRGLAASMKTELKAMTDGIMASHATLKRVATVDMTDNLRVKDRMEALLRALVDRNGDLQAMVADAVRQSGAISADVEQMVTGVQFQDRTKQRLELVVDTLRVIGQALEEIKSSTRAAVPGLPDSCSPETGWVKALLARCTMSDMRERFVAQILDGRPVSWGDDAAETDARSSAGSAELF